MNSNCWITMRTKWKQLLAKNHWWKLIPNKSWSISTWNDLETINSVAILNYINIYLLNWSNNWSISSLINRKVWSHVRKPVGVLTGMVSQFLLLPFSAYCLVHILAIEPLHAAGLLILASSPGGVTSNLFTYFCDGDVSLRWLKFKLN